MRQTLEDALKCYRRDVSRRVYEAVADALDKQGLRISPSQVRTIDLLLPVEWAKQIKLSAPALRLVK